MSVAPLHRAGSWSFDDLDQLPHDGCRYEVVDGALLMTPPPTDHHQAVSRRLFRQLDRQATPEWEPVYEVASGCAPTAACQTSLSCRPDSRFARERWPMWPRTSGC
jgi:Uma2 family endonuclease